MNKKGFTLVELLAVILILGVVTIIAVPAALSISNSSKQKMLKTKIELAGDSLRLWAQDNKKCFTGEGIDCILMSCSGTETITCNVTLKSMADYGLLDYDDVNQNIINPVNKENINNHKITVQYNTSTKAISVDNHLNELIN